MEKCAALNWLNIYLSIKFCQIWFIMFSVVLLTNKQTWVTNIPDQAKRPSVVYELTLSTSLDVGHKIEKNTQRNHTQNFYQRNIYQILKIHNVSRPRAFSVLWVNCGLNPTPLPWDRWPPGMNSKLRSRPVRLSIQHTTWAPIPLYIQRCNKRDFLWSSYISEFKSGIKTVLTCI